MESSLLFYQNENKTSYTNKNILITGATGGIGQKLIDTLYNLGANLLLISQDENKLKSKLEKYLTLDSSVKINSNRKNEELIPQIQYEIINLENPLDINEKFHSIMKKLKGKLDILFICHGQYNFNSIKDCDAKTFDSIMNINVRSVFHILSLAVPFLKITKGNCVIISSLESIIPIKNGFLNSTTKAMINCMVKNAALELASFGVRINAVAPAITDTEHRNNIVNIEIKNKDSMFPLGKKILQPENVVDTLLFLGSDEASFITGEIIQNDNGYGLNHDLSFTHDI